MKFNVETDAFIHLLEMLMEQRPGQRRGFGSVRLTARRGRLSVEHQDQVAEIETGVWQEGSCSVSAPRLLSAVKSCREQVDLTLESRGQRLLVVAFALRLLSAEPAPRSLRPSKIFLSTKAAFFDIRLAPGQELVGTT